MQGGSIYRKETEAFLESLRISMGGVRRIWQDMGTFAAPDVLLPLLVEHRKPSSENLDFLRRFAAFSAQKDCRVAAFPRMDFMLGLADIYAAESTQPCHVVEIDVSNCNGAAQWLGTDRMTSLFKVMNETFISALKAEGSSFAFSFDNAKNDDFKILTGGLSPGALSRALLAAQKELDLKLIFAADLPHSKYDEKRGLGVGYSAHRLGQGHALMDVEADLYRQVEDSKDASFINRNQIIARYPGRQAVPLCVAGLLADEVLAAQGRDLPLLPPVHAGGPAHAVGPVSPPEARKHKVLQAGVDQGLRKHDMDLLSDLASFCFRKDGLTGAENGDWLLADIRHQSNTAGGAVGVLNFKLENSAGVNGMLSRTHSVAMARDFVRLVEKCVEKDSAGSQGGWVYHVGRNSFNILLGKTVTPETAAHFEERLSAIIDERINDKTVKDYFNCLGVDVTSSFKGDGMKMADIPNLRGNRNGIRAINFSSANFSDSVSDRAIAMFQGNATPLPQSIRYEYNRRALKDADPSIFGSEQVSEIAALYRKARQKFTF